MICLDKGATVDAIGGELHATPLHWATRQGHLDACVILMNASADPTLRDAEGCSCIHLAAQFGHTALVCIIDYQLEGVFLIVNVLFIKYYLHL